MIQRQDTPKPEDRDDLSLPEDRPEVREEPVATAAEGATDDEAGTDAYTVHLEDFDGPLDLLLYLIQRDEVDIYDIPIAHITKQYLEFIDLLDAFDLDNAGEFLVMAATLMRIKARLLLPIQRVGDEEDDDVDPRDELVRRLLEYKKYKEASEKLAKREEERRHYFTRGTEYSFADEDVEPPELSLSLFDLLRAVKNVLDDMQGDAAHQVYTEVYTVESQEEMILERVTTQPRLRFDELFSEMRVKMEVVVTFIALLDLMKAQRIKVQQSDSYSDMWIVAREPDPPAEVDADTVVDAEVAETPAQAAAASAGSDEQPSDSLPAAERPQEDPADAT